MRLPAIVIAGAVVARPRKAPAMMGARLAVASIKFIFLASAFSVHRRGMERDTDKTRDPHTMHTMRFHARRASMYASMHTMRFAVLFSHLITGTSALSGSWRLKLSLGPQPGVYMPNKLDDSRWSDGWGTAAPQVVVSLKVGFDSAMAIQSDRLADAGLYGKEVHALQVQECNARVVTFEGEKEVAFTSGGWFIRSEPLATGLYSNYARLLHFWLDCPSGCTKRDVALLPGERLYFKTLVFDGDEAFSYVSAKRVRAKRRLAELEAGLAEPTGGVLEQLPMLTQIPGVQQWADFQRRVATFDERINLEHCLDYLKHFSFPEDMVQGEESPAEGLSSTAFANKGLLQVRRESESQLTPFGPKDGLVSVGFFAVEPVLGKSTGRSIDAMVDPD